MAFNYTRSQAVADKMITKYGMKAVLRRESMDDRPCIVVETDFTPMERQGKLINPTDRIFLISAKELLLPPLFQVDTLVTLKPPDFVDDNEILKLSRKPGRLAPAGTVIYWEVFVDG